MSVTILDGDARFGPSVLFAEDFDHPTVEEPAPEPEVIEPTFTVAEMEACRQEAWRAGEASGTASATAASTAAASRVLSEIGALLAQTRAESTQAADESAHAVARLLFDGLAALFPTLNDRLGEQETRAVVATVLPALRQDPRPTVRVPPSMADAVIDEIERAEPGVIEQIRIVGDETMKTGDIRVTWRNGCAERDGQALWREILEILGQSGLTADMSAERESCDVE